MFFFCLKLGYNKYRRDMFMWIEIEDGFGLLNKMFLIYKFEGINDVNINIRKYFYF